MVPGGCGSPIGKGIASLPSLVQAAVDRLYIAAHRVQGASGADAPAADENLEQAVHEALRASVSDRKIQHVTGFSKDRIHALRPMVIPKPRPERTAVAHPRPRPQPRAAASPPLVWPDWVIKDLAAIKRYEDKTPRIKVVSGGLPGLGKRR